MGDVLGELRDQSVLVGDVIPGLGLLDGMLGEEVGEEVDCIYPLRFAIAGQKFFVKNDAPFGVDACSGVAWGPFDGAVDLFILKTFVNQSSVIVTPVVGSQLSMYRCCGSKGSENRYIDSWLTHSAMMRMGP